VEIRKDDGAQRFETDSKNSFFQNVWLVGFNRVKNPVVGMTGTLKYSVFGSGADFFFKKDN